MGICLSCLPCSKENKKEYNDHLIRDKYCEQCKIIFLSNYEYNKHIPTCNGRHGDI